MPASAFGGGRGAAAARLAYQVAAAGPPAVLAGRDALLRAGREAAVDDQGVAADEPGVVAGQPQRGLCDVGGLADPAPQRRPGPERLAGLVHGVGVTDD